MNVALRSDSLNFISLCTGGGGLDFGVELAIPDARPVVLVEGEAWSVATLVQAMEARLMAPAPVWSNVRTFDGRPWRGLVDGLIGGIPCQPHSLAGKRGGQDDERDLWSPTRRIIVQSGAWWVLIENVRGMLSAKEGQTAGAERVWRDLQRLGFAVEVGLFTAAEVGASHERERVFILGVANTDISQPSINLRIRGNSQSECTPVTGVCRELADAGCQRDERWRRPGDILCAPGAGQGEGNQWQRDGHAVDDRGNNLADTSSERGRPISIQPRRQDEAGADVERSCPDMVDAISGGHDWQSEDAIGREIRRTAIEWSGRDRFPALYPPRPSDIDSWRRVLAHSPHLEPAVRRMADGVAARLDLSGPHAARIERLRMLGNGVVPLEAAYALRTLATRLAVRSDGAKRLVRMMVEP